MATVAVMTAVSLAISVAVTAQQVVQQNANNRALEKAQAKKNEQNQQSLVANYDELADVELEAQQQANTEALTVQKGYIADKGRVNVMAAAMGTGGQSVSNQLQDVEAKKYNNYNTILLNRQSNMDNLSSQARSLQFQTAANIDVSPISRPSTAAAALNIGSQLVSGYGKYQELSKTANQLSTGG